MVWSYKTARKYGQILVRNARSIIRHRNQCIGSRRNDGGLAVNVFAIQIYFRGFDAQVAALRHGVSRVSGQIHQDLFDLQRIDPYASQPFAGKKCKFDVFPDQAGKRFGDAFDDGD